MPSNSADVPSIDESITLSSLMDSFSRQYPHVTKDDIWALAVPTGMVAGMASSTGYGAASTAFFGTTAAATCAFYTFFLSDAATEANKKKLESFKHYGGVAGLAGLGGTAFALSLSELLDATSMAALVPTFVMAQGAHVHFLANKREDTIEAKSGSNAFPMSDMPGGMAGY